MVRDHRTQELVIADEALLPDAEVIVVAGRAVKKVEDMALINRLAELLNAKIAATRPLIEAGWVDAKR